MKQASGDADLVIALSAMTLLIQQMDEMLWCHVIRCSSHLVGKADKRGGSCSATARQAS